VYVNPVIALCLGSALNGEQLGARTLAGTVLVLVAVALVGRADPIRSRADSTDSTPSFSTEPSHTELAQPPADGD
jgi:drug/metabolite transporter (DMT)-like permease